MPFMTTGKEVTRGTICKDTFRAQVTLMCSDRIPAGAASHLLLDIQWRKKRGGREEIPGQSDAAKITLTLRKLTEAASGDIRFDAQNGPTTKDFTQDTRQFLVIYGQTATAGSAADVALDVKVEGELQSTVSLSVGPVTPGVVIRAPNGVDEARFFMLPEVTTRLTAVTDPPTTGTFRWASGNTNLAINGVATNPTVEVVASRPPGALPPIPDRHLRLAVLFTPQAAGAAVMSVHETWPIYDPEEPGPFPVGSAHYPSASFTPPDMTLPAGLDGWPLDITVPLEALVRYPAAAAAAGAQFSPKHPKYPLVILAHGRHGASEFERLADGSVRLSVAGRRIPIKNAAGERVEFKNFEGLEYLASHLASYGFVAASINLNGKFDPATGAGELVTPQGATVTCRPTLVDEAAITQRGLVVLRHIQALRDLNTSDPIFQNKVDLDNIGLVGHSRGGDAVVAAQDTNASILMPLTVGENIKAIVSIAPTDNRNLNAELPYLLLIGTDDADVSDLQGLRLYDRALPPKQGVIVVGAIHNFFSSNWQWQDEVSSEPPVSRAQHESIARGYCNLFLQRYVNGLSGEAPYFTGARRLNLPASVELHFAYQAANRLLVDAFEEVPTDKVLNSLNEPVTTNTVASFDEVDLHHLTDACGLNLATWFQDTHGLMLEWSSLAASYTSALGGLSVQRVQPFEALSFRVAQDGDVNPPGVAQDFRVRLTDTDGAEATLKVSDFGVIPPPRTKTVNGSSVTMSVLKTIRIPLQRFKQQNASLRLDSLASVSFLFNEKVPGKLAFDDIEFSH